MKLRCTRLTLLLLVAAVDASLAESVAAGEPPRLIERHLREFLGS